MTARNDVLNRIGENGEEWVQSCVLDACRGNMRRVVVFDVGANIGDWLHSLLGVAEHLGCLSQLDVHAFEPVPSTYERLLNRAQNDLRAASVEVVCLAMSSSEGSDSIFVVGDGAGTNSLHQGSSSVYTQSLVIAKDTIDHYLQENNIVMVHLLKCDTEGHDMEVLRGAQDSLRHERIRVLQFEYNHRWVYSRNFLKDVFDLIADLPYGVGKVTPGFIEFYSEWHPEMERFFEGNYVLVHRDARQWFSHRLMEFDASNAMHEAKPERQS
ncbi:MAG TPA: FkbM family methyltransferase [Bacteriovoracaceae bacterium]|nr:FkbM family methyltransferase [Bacteriovoracaceae bacterium]